MFSPNLPQAPPQPPTQPDQSVSNHPSGKKSRPNPRKRKSLRRDGQHDSFYSRRRGAHKFRPGRDTKQPSKSSAHPNGFRGEWRAYGDRLRYPYRFDAGSNRGRYEPKYERDRARKNPVDGSERETKRSESKRKSYDEKDEDRAPKGRNKSKTRGVESERGSEVRNEENKSTEAETDRRNEIEERERERGTDEKETSAAGSVHESEILSGEKQIGGETVNHRPAKKARGRPRKKDIGLPKKSGTAARSGPETVVHQISEANSSGGDSKREDETRDREVVPESCGGPSIDHIDSVLRKIMDPKLDITIDKLDKLIAETKEEEKLIALNLVRKMRFRNPSICCTSLPKPISSQMSYVRKHADEKSNDCQSVNDHGRE